MTIDSSIRNKVIELHRNKGMTRDAIAKELNIATGSVSNILAKSKHQNDQSLQPHASVIQSHANVNERSNTIFEQPSDRTTTDVSIIQTIDSNNLGSPVGLKPTIEDSAVAIDFDNKPYPEFYPADDVTGRNQVQVPTLEEPIFVSAKEVNIGPDHNVKYFYRQNEKVEEVKVDQPKISLPAAENQGSSIIDSDSDIEDPPNWDPDSQTIWQRKLIKAWSMRGRQIQMIEEGRRQLQEESEQLESMRQSVKLEMNELKVRQSKLAEVEHLVPLARRLQLMGTDVRNFLPWADLVQNYAETHNTDLTKAAFDIAKKLEAFKDIETMWSFARKQDDIISAQAAVINTNQTALATLKTLHGLGYTRKNIQDLTGLINMWNRGDFNINRKLDDELYIQKGKEPVFNGSSRHFMREFIRSNMLVQLPKNHKLQQPEQKQQSGGSR